MNAPRPATAICAGLVLLAAIALALVTLLHRNARTPLAPAAQAEVDGFEALVYDVDPAGIIANVRTLPFRQARDACAAGSVARLPNDPAARATLERAIPNPHTGADSRASVTTHDFDPTHQEVRLEFHDPLRTYIYEYTVDGPDLIPTSATYRDLNTSREVHYAPQ